MLTISKALSAAQVRTYHAEEFTNARFWVTVLFNRPAASPPPWSERTLVSLLGQKEVPPAQLMRLALVDRRRGQ